MSRRQNRWDAMRAGELRKIMGIWPSVMRQASDDWAQDFAQNVWKRSGNGQWRPTLRQAAVMRRMIRQLPDEQDPHLIIIE